MKLEESRFHALVVVAVILWVLGPTLFPPARGLDSPPSTRDLGGIQAFPPVDISRENESAALAAWIGEALDLETIDGARPTILPHGPNMSFSDGFNRTMTVEDRATDYLGANGSLIALHYERTTRELVTARIRPSPALVLGGQTLAEVGEVVAASLGFSLSGSAYVEYGRSYPRRADPNGTEDAWGVEKVGTWTQSDGGFQINFANQLEVVVDREHAAVVSIAMYRWFAVLPPVVRSENEVLAAAADSAEYLYGSRTFTEYEVGLAPNYRNLTWSFLVDLHAFPSWGYETFVVLLEAETLVPQRVEYRLVSSAGPAVTAFGIGLPLAALVFAAVCFLAVRWKRARPGRFMGREQR